MTYHIVSPLRLKERVFLADKKVDIFLIFCNNVWCLMSKELQERADEIMEELKDALVPLKKEIKRIKTSSDRFI